MTDDELRRIRAILQQPDLSRAERLCLIEAFEELVVKVKNPPPPQPVEIDAQAVLDVLMDMFFERYVYYFGPGDDPPG